MEFVEFGMFLGCLAAFATGFGLIFDMGSRAEDHDNRIYCIYEFFALAGLSLYCFVLVSVLAHTTGVFGK